MSGLSGHAINLVRRGLEAAPNDIYVAQLRQQANSYENAGPSAEVQPWELFLPLITTFAITVIIASVRYTLGEVVASLAMIEQPKTIIVVSEAHGDSDPDAALEKTALIDEEVVMFKEESITSSIRKTMKHLHQVGGFRARWRGLGAATAYHMLHSFTANTLLSVVSMVFPIISYGGQIPAAVAASVLLSRIHMTWTHVMISQPSPLPWYRRIVGGRKAFKTVALPSFVFAVAQQITIILPIAVFFSLGGSLEVPLLTGQKEPFRGDVLALRLFASLVVLAFTAVAILLPASVTLTRIEASLLPDDQETIVSFDRTLNGAATSAISLGTAASSKSLFIEAWRSFNMESRRKLVKFYIKMFFVQLYIGIAGSMMVIGEIMLIGPERLANIVMAGSAQLRLAAMGQ